MAGIAYQIFDLGHAPANARNGAIQVLLVLAGIIAALALLAGARWGARGATSSATLSGAAAALAGIHGAIVFLGGALSLGASCCGAWRAFAGDAWCYAYGRSLRLRRYSVTM